MEYSVENTQAVDSGNPNCQLGLLTVNSSVNRQLSSIHLVIKYIISVMKCKLYKQTDLKNMLVNLQSILGGGSKEVSQLIYRTL